MEFTRVWSGVRGMVVSQEVEKALDLYRPFGRAIVEERDLASLINRYGGLIDQSARTMREVGVTGACTACAGENENGCCFRGVEEWYDVYLLLINLLFERALPLTYDFPEGCLFVGQSGCKLMAKHSFCLNYLCPTLTKGLAPVEQKRLSKAIGEEILAGWELEKALRGWLQRHGIR